MFSVKNMSAGTIVNIVPDTPLLGKVEHVEVLATGGYKLAKSYTDVDAKQAEIFSSLQTPELVDDVRAYTYIIIENREGIPEAYADAWIKSITVVDKITANFKIQLDNLDELVILRKVLQGRGFDPEIEIIEK